MEREKRWMAVGLWGDGKKRANVGGRPKEM